MRDIFEKKTKKNLWRLCLDFLKTVVNEEDFKNWIEPIKPIKIEGKTLIIQVPNDIFYEHIEENFADYIFSFLEEEMGDGVDLKYQIPKDEREEYQKEDTPKIKKINSNLNDNYNFNNYIIGDFNKVAGMVGIKISEAPGRTSFNPLIVYGKTGMGKTHLVNAIGFRTEQMNPDKKVLYVSSESFIQQYTLSVAEKKRNDFINFYQNIDILIVDDIQFLSGKEGTQNVFFSIFNHLHQLGKQIILTSDELPSQIKDIQERLISRFKWGLCAEISNPSIEDRSLILKSKLDKDGIVISDEIFDFIVKQLNTNVREIEGAVISLLAHSSLLKTEITLDLAKNVLKQYIREVNDNRVISIDEIKDVVCEYFGISPEKLNSKSRERKVVVARQIAMYLSKKYTEKSLVYIGKNIGNRNYSTVVYACKTLENLTSIDKQLRKEFDAIEVMLLS